MKNPFKRGKKEESEYKVPKSWRKPGSVEPVPIEKPKLRKERHKITIPHLQRGKNILAYILISINILFCLASYNTSPLFSVFFFLVALIQIDYLRKFRKPKKWSQEE